MKLKVLGSSSSGNCYLLESETECLIIECGVKFAEIKKALDFNVSKIVGVIASHSHKDHFGYARDYLKAGIPIKASQKTWGSPDIEVEISDKIMRCGYWYQFGGFNVTAFDCVHDVECYGFIIRHDKIGTLLFATDTEYIKYNFKGLKLDHILIECNYSQKIIDSRVENEELHQGLRNRVLKSHMELETCKSFIKINQTPNLMNIVLLHLSDGNSNERLFQDEVKKIAGNQVNVVVADRGVEIVLDLIPF